jgi:hypothetical protein
MNLVREFSAFDAEACGAMFYRTSGDRTDALDHIATSAVRKVLRVHKVPTYCPALTTKQ